MRLSDVGRKLVAVAGLLWAGSGVHGIQIDVTDPSERRSGLARALSSYRPIDSLKAAAETAKENMLVCVAASDSIGLSDDISRCTINPTGQAQYRGF